MRRAFVWLWLLLATASCASADPRAFDDVKQAARQVTAVVTARGSLAQFAGAVARFSTAIDQLKAKPLSSKERSLAAEYEGVRQSLDDIRLVWEEKEKRQQELLPIAEPLPARLQKTYDLPINSNEPPSIYASEARQMIWDGARTKLEALQNR